MIKGFGAEIKGSDGFSLLWLDHFRLCSEYHVLNKVPEVFTDGLPPSAAVINGTCFFFISGRH